MAKVLKIRDKPVTIYDEADFARILRDELGDDAERYYREILNGWSRDQEEHECCGECDRVYELQQHFESVLEDALNAMSEIKNKVLFQTKDETIFQLNDLFRTIKSEL